MFKPYLKNLAAAALLSGIGVGTAQAQTARVQVIHNSADVVADSVDVYLDGVLLLDNFAFRNASPFIDAPAGTPIQIDIAPKTSTSVANSIANFSYTLAANETYVIVAEGITGLAGSYTPNEPFDLKVYSNGQETATTAGNVSVLVHHGCTDAPMVDVAETGVGAGVIVDDISYAEFQGYLDLGTVDYRLQVQVASSGDAVASYEAPLQSLNLADQAIVVVASGFLDPSMNENGAPFGLYVALPSGGEMVELPQSTARLQVIHNSSDDIADSVDVYLNGNLLLNDFAYRNATPFIDAPAGVPIEIDIAPKTSTSVANSIANFPLTLTPEETYVVVADGITGLSSTTYNPATPFNLEIYAMGREAANTAGNTDVLVHHGSTDAPTVDVWEMAAVGGEIVGDLAYADFQGYLELATADYVLEVRDMTGATTVASYDAPLATLMLQDEALVVVASGFLDPTMNGNGPAFGLWVALPSGGEMVELPASSARMQVIHNSADDAAEMVDVYVNGVLTVDDFEFRTATPFIDVPAGVEIEVDIAPSNSTSVANSIANFPLTLTSNETYIVVADGITGLSSTTYTPATPFNLEIYVGGRESATMAANTDVLVHHGSTDAPIVDVYETAIANTTIVDDIDYSEFQGYLELATADYNLEIRDQSGATTVAAFGAPLQSLSLQGEAITVVASGFLDPTVNGNGPAFGLWAALAAGGDLVELPVTTGITELENDFFTIYPNPANDFINIQSKTGSAILNVEIVDARGQVVSNSPVNGNQLSVSELADGVYFVRVTSEEGVAVMQFLKR